MEKFRVISDLHLDINHDYPIKEKGDGVFTIVAGDICGSSCIVENPPNDKYAVKVLSDEKLSNAVGVKNGKFSIMFNEKDNCWKFGEKKIDLDKSGLRINRYSDSLLEKSIPSDGDKIDFKVMDVEKWMRKTMSSGVFVAGNHLVYNRDGHTLEELKDNLHGHFPLEDNITFLDNSVGLMAKEVDGILFVGSTLYTNYAYLSPNSYFNGKCESVVENNMRLASPKVSGGGMNDFNFGRVHEGTYEKTFEDGSEPYWLTPQNYLNYFNRTFKELMKIVKENGDKEIVVVSHHCPSPKCISSDYVDSEMNASYISDLDVFIEDNPNIKCWVCGHVHHRDNFKIGNCRVVMNPLGYCSHGQFRKNNENETDWSFNTFVNTKTWEVEKEPFDTSKWNRKYEKELKRRREIYKMFGGAFF